MSAPPAALPQRGPVIALIVITLTAFSPRC
jgi:hypothetical protein